MADRTKCLRIPCGQLRLWQEMHTECPYRIACERPGTRARMMLSRQAVFSEFENRLGTADLQMRASVRRRCRKAMTSLKPHIARFSGCTLARPSTHRRVAHHGLLHLRRQALHEHAR